MLDKIKISLRNYGFSEKEAAVYIATTLLGTSKASEISEKSNLLRETTYAVIKQLEEKGFLNHSIREGIKYYSVANPQRLIESLDEKKSQIQNTVKELQNLNKTSLSKTRVEFYKGETGIMSATEDLVRKKNIKINAYVNTSVLQVIPFYHPQFRRKRKENKVHMDVIAERSKGSNELKSVDRHEMRNTRVLNRILEDLNISFYIYDNKIQFLKASKTEQMSIIITDDEFAKFNRRIFYELWKLSN